MYESINQQVEQVIQRIKDNPVHMRKCLERGKKRKKKASAYRNTRLHCMAEEEIFDDSEDITVYVDFCGGIFPGTEPLEERREKARRFLHAHDFFEMMYVYSGMCYCNFDHREYALPEGSIWMFNTQCAHSVVVPNDGSTLINILLRKSTFSAALLGMINDNDLFLGFFLNSIYNSDSAPKQLQFTAEPGGMSEFYIFKIIEEYAGKSPYSQSIMKHLFCCLLAELTRQYRERADSRGRESGLHISQVISYISDNYRTATLQSTAEHFHYNPSYLSKYMLKHTNQTFSEYLTRFKLEKAAHLLTSTALPLERVASLTGYSERSAFDKAFKKYSGLTPRQYRSQKQSATLVPQEKTQ